jgi:hypothetical protein
MTGGKAAAGGLVDTKEDCRDVTNAKYSGVWGSNTLTLYGLWQRVRRTTTVSVAGTAMW